MEATYEKVLASIPKRDKNIARKILMLVCYAFEPLTAEELAIVVGLPKPESILDICTSSLVVFHETYESPWAYENHRPWSNKIDRPTLPSDSWKSLHSSSTRSSGFAIPAWGTYMSPHGRWRRTVKLDHFSVEEFLLAYLPQLRKESTVKSFGLNPLLPHLEISAILVGFFINAEGDKTVPIAAVPLLYAQRWYEHVQKAGKLERHLCSVDEDVAQRVAEWRVQTHRIFCADHSRSLQRWRQLVVMNGDIDWEHDLMCTKSDGRRFGSLATSPIEIACALRLSWHLRRLLEASGDHTEREQLDLLSIAALGTLEGSYEMANILLEYGFEHRLLVRVVDDANDAISKRRPQQSKYKMRIEGTTSSESSRSSSSYESAASLVEEQDILQREFNTKRIA